MVDGRIGWPALVDANAVPVGQPGVGSGVGWIEGNRLLEPGSSLREIFEVEAIELGERPQHAIIGFQVVRPLSERPVQLDLADLRRNGAGHAGRDLVLQGEEVFGSAVEMTAPYHRSVACLGELDGYAQPSSRPTDAAGQGVLDAKLAPHPGDVSIRPIADRRAPRDDEELPERREGANNILNDPGAEVVLILTLRFAPER